MWYLWAYKLGVRRQHPGSLLSSSICTCLFVLTSTLPIKSHILTRWPSAISSERTVLQKRVFGTLSPTDEGGGGRSDPEVLARDKLDERQWYHRFLAPRTTPGASGLILYEHVALSFVYN